MVADGGFAIIIRAVALPDADRNGLAGQVVGVVEGVYVRERDVEPVGGATAGTPELVGRLAQGGVVDGEVAVVGAVFEHLAAVGAPERDIGRGGYLNEYLDGHTSISVKVKSTSERSPARSVPLMATEPMRQSPRSISNMRMGSDAHCSMSCWSAAAASKAT